MIFVTVGTDHHQFTRLLKKVDNLIGSGRICSNVVMQYGYNKLIPSGAYARHKLISFEKVLELIRGADIVITHASSTAMLAITEGKVPIVVPRDPKFNEIIDGHQIEFARSMGNMLPMIVVYDIDELEDVIINFSKIEKETKKQTSTLGGAKNIKAVDVLNELVDGWYPSK